MKPTYKELKRESEVKNIYVVIQRRIVLAYPAHKSDDCAVAAFSDESKANAFSNTFNSYVASIPLDTPHAEPFTDKSIFVVYSKNKDITVDYVAPASRWNIADGVAQKVFIEELNYTHRVYTYVFARDMKQAMEIATDRFYQHVSQKGDFLIGSLKQFNETMARRNSHNDGTV